ncbi:MAG: GT4 family glycosyltransferase PelF [bacterium]
MRDTKRVGGPERLILSLAKNIDSTSFRLIIASFVDEGSENELLSEATRRGFETAIVFTSSFNWTEIFRLSFLLKKNSIDILHTHGYRADIIGYLATKIVGIPIVSSAHGWAGYPKKVRVYEHIDRFFLLFFDKVIAVSEAMREGLIRIGIPRHKVVTIYNTIDLENYQFSDNKGIREELKVDNRVKLVGTLGRLSPEKGHTYFLESAAEVIREYPEVRFIIAGEGPERSRLEELVERLGILQKVFFLGHRRDVERIFNSIDIFVLPSLSEGMPMTILEAMAFGKPTIATDVGGVSRLINEKTGLLVPSKDPSLLTAAIISLLKDPEKAQLMGLCARKRVEEEFAPEQMVKDTEKVYLEVLKRGSTGFCVENR